MTIRPQKNALQRSGCVQCTYKKKEVNRLSTGTPVLFFLIFLRGVLPGAPTCPADGLAWIRFHAGK